MHVAWRGVLLAVLCCIAVTSSAQKTREDIIAAYLFNFTKFVEWPESASDSFNLCVLGNSPVVQSLRGFQGQKVASKPVEIYQYRNVRLVEDCRVLFITMSEASVFEDQLEKLVNKPVLTVSALPGFAKAGGGIQLLEQNARISFHINRNVTRANGLQVSSKLLRLSKEP